MASWCGARLPQRMNALTGTKMLLLLALTISLSFAPVNAFQFGSHSAPPAQAPNAKNGATTDQFTPEEIRRLPWYIVLEKSPLRLGAGPYGLPYKMGEPNIRYTMWERNPKMAMCHSLLNLAEDNGPVEQAEKLLRIGADPNYQHPTEGYTALHAAALRGNTRLLQVLVSKGGNLKKRTACGTPLDIARQNNRKETAEWIEARLQGK